MCNFVFEVIEFITVFYQYNTYIYKYLWDLKTSFIYFPDISGRTPFMSEFFKSITMAFQSMLDYLTFTMCSNRHFEERFRYSLSGVELLYPQLRERHTQPCSWEQITVCNIVHLTTFSNCTSNWRLHVPNKTWGKHCTVEKPLQDFYWVRWWCLTIQWNYPSTTQAVKVTFPFSNFAMTLSTQHMWRWNKTLGNRPMQTTVYCQN